MSLVFTDVVAVRSYVETNYAQFLRRIFYGFKSAEVFNPHEGVKGKELMTQMTIGQLVKKYGKTFQPVADAVTFSPRWLEVFAAKVDLKIYPQDFETNYLGLERQKGQGMDIPREGIIFEELLNGISQEMEDAVWNAAIPGVPTATDPLSLLFDGLKEQIKDGIGSLAPVATGALTESNAFTSIRNVFKATSKAWKDRGMDCFINPNTALLASIEYQNLVGKYTDASGIGFTIPKVNVIVLPGIPDNCILMTPRENIHYGYDSAMDHTMFNFEQEDRAIKFWMDFKIGVTFGIFHSSFIYVNNQWTV